MAGGAPADAQEVPGVAPFAAALAVRGDEAGDAEAGVVDLVAVGVVLGEVLVFGIRIAFLGEAVVGEVAGLHVDGVGVGVFALEVSELGARFGAGGHGGLMLECRGDVR